MILRNKIDKMGSPLRHIYHQHVEAYGVGPAQSYQNQAAYKTKKRIANRTIDNYKESVLN